MEGVRILTWSQNSEQSTYSHLSRSEHPKHKALSQHAESLLLQRADQRQAGNGISVLSPFLGKVNAYSRLKHLCGWYERDKY